VRLGTVWSLQDPPGSPIGHQALYEAAVEQVVHSETLGYEHVNLTEHHVSADGYLPALLPMLAALAVVTQRIRLSTGMLILPLHHPVRVAEEAAVIDLLSGGRLTLGVAAGYREVEFETFGIDPRTRGKRMRESLEVLLRAWTGEPFSYAGEILSVPEVTVRPLPLQRPHPPLWLGGTTEPALRRAVAYGSPCFPGSTDDRAYVADRFWRFCDLREAAGASGPAELVLPRLALVADTTEEARRRAYPAIRTMYETYASWGLPVDFAGPLSRWEALDEFVIVGDEARCAEAMARYAELGVTDLLAQFAMPTLAPEVAAESLERFAVLADLAGGTGPAGLDPATTQETAWP